MVKRPHLAETVEFPRREVVGLVPDRRDLDRLGDVPWAHRFPDFSRTAATQKAGEPEMLEHNLSRLVPLHRWALAAPLRRGARTPSATVNSKQICLAEQRQADLNPQLTCQIP